MYQAPIHEPSTKFPVIHFRKKRLTIAIHAHFDLECGEDAASVKQMIEAATNQLTQEGHAKVSYSVTDL